MAKSAKTTKKTPARGAKQTALPEKSAQRGAGREVGGVLLFCAAALLFYFLFTDPQAGFGREIVRAARGLAGALSFALPLILAWAGLALAFSRQEKPLRLRRVLLVAILILLVMALVHLFSADAIMQGASPINFSVFLQRSFDYQTGGAGWLGALLCWHLYWNLDIAGACIILIALILINLILQRKISLAKIGKKAQERYDVFREQQHERAERKMELREMAQREREAAIPKIAPRPTEEGDPFAKYLGDSARVRKGHGDREMRVERIDREPMPGEPKVAPLPPEEAAPVDDIPSFLSGRKKGRVKAEPIHVSEPKPLPKFAPAAPDPDGSEVAETPPAAAPIVSGDVDDETLDRFMSDDFEEITIGEPAPKSTEKPLPVAKPAPIDEADDVPEADEPPFDVPEVPFETQKSAPVKLTKKPLYPIAKPVPAQVVTPPEETPYEYPPMELLAASKPSVVRNHVERDRQKGELLIKTLLSFGIETKLVGIAHGPTITRFELTPAPGVKVSRITSLTDDIALNLAATTVRIEAPIPGKSAVGVEVPNEVVETVPLRDVLESNECQSTASRLAVALGRDNAGRYIIADLAKMPHTLIAGQTGSGKSVCVNCIICSILYRATPQEVRMILIDPKVVELSCYNGVPHLLVPVVTDPAKAAGALDWAVQEMTTRYKKFAELGVRNMKGYNQHRPPEEPAMPQIVIIIDELADLMMVAPSDVEDAICRLAQLARAAGIHLVIATQRPSVDVITGKIKANIPSRIAFQTASQVDSRTILDVGGAEKLLGQGDMLYAPSGAAKRRAQGAWVSDDEVSAIVDYLKVRNDARYDDDVIEHIDTTELSDAEREDKLAEFDDLLPSAVELVVESEQASVSLLQRRLRVGHSRAGRLIDEMEVRGIVGPDEGSKARKVLMTREQYRAQYKTRGPAAPANEEEEEET